MSHTPTQHHSRHASIPSHVPLSEPTELDLSPSKARAHATNAHAWTQVTTWLAQQLKQSGLPPQHGALPPFERNAATLAYLQELIRANRAADAGRRRVFEAQSAQVEAYTAAAEINPPSSGGGHELEQGGSRALLDALTRGVEAEGDGEAALGSLAEACVALGHIPAGTRSVEAELAPRLLALTASVFELEEQLAVLAESRAASEAQLAAAMEEERQEDGEDEGNGSMGGDGTAAAANGEPSIAVLRQQTSQLSAQTKHLALKLAEYQDRISALERSDGGPGFGLEEVKQKEREVAAYRDIVRRLEDRLNEYHGLPPDLEASRAELRRTQAELDMWRTRREELFGQMDEA